MCMLGNLVIHRTQKMFSKNVYAWSSCLIVNSNNLKKKLTDPFLAIVGPFLSTTTFLTFIILNVPQNKVDVSFYCQTSL